MAKEGDKVAEWQTWEREVRQHSYKAFRPLFAFKGFWEAAPRFVPLRILQSGLMGRYLGFHVTTAHIAHLSL